MAQSPRIPQPEYPQKPPQPEYQDFQTFAMGKTKPPRGWVGKSLIGIFYLTVASMFTTGCAAAYVVGMIAMGYFGVDEFNHLVSQIHHYRDTALLAAGGSSLAPILRYGVPALWNTFIGSIAVAVHKLNK